MVTFVLQSVLSASAFYPLLSSPCAFFLSGLKYSYQCSLLSLEIRPLVREIILLVRKLPAQTAAGKAFTCSRAAIVNHLNDRVQTNSENWKNLPQLGAAPKRRVNFKHALISESDGYEEDIFLLN